MLKCEKCGRETPVLTKMNVMRTDLSVSVCPDCQKEIEEQNKLFVKVQLISCIAVGFASAVIILVSCIILFSPVS